MKLPFTLTGGTSPSGKKVELHGYGRHSPDDACTFEVHKIS
jgi:hypothetical protein